MKNHITFICLMALVLTACHKPEPEMPNGGETTQDTIVPQEPDTLVKKYLERKYYVNSDSSIDNVLTIIWDESYEMILRIESDRNGPYYDFTYYGADSIRVDLSVSQSSYPSWLMRWTMIMLRLKDGKIDNICCYDEDGILKDTEYYSYDETGRLVERKYYGGVDHFSWDGENVTSAQMIWETVEYKGFTSYIHPEYTLPFYLSNEVSLEVHAALLKPLWKNAPQQENVSYTTDADGYVIEERHFYFNGVENMVSVCRYEYGKP